jgi:hypothetical protein
MLQMKDATQVDAIWVKLPLFTSGLHADLQAGKIDCYRVPRYSDKPTAARLQLEATSEHDARERIAAALSDHDHLAFHPVADVIAGPRMIGGSLTGDGSPETQQTPFFIGTASSARQRAAQKRFGGPVRSEGCLEGRNGRTRTTGQRFKAGSNRCKLIRLGPEVLLAAGRGCRLAGRVALRVGVVRAAATVAGAERRVAERGGGERPENAERGERHGDALLHVLAPRTSMAGVRRRQRERTSMHRSEGFLFPVVT